MVSFENTEIAFRDKSGNKLRKAYWLFRMVGSPLLVKTGSGLLKAALWMRLPVNWALKPTVFSHFCGGETIADCQPTIRQLGESNVLTILDYSAEGKSREEDFDHTRDQILATIDKAAEERHIPYAVFKPTGMASFELLAKVQSGAALNAAEEKAFERAKSRFDRVCAYGVSKGVPVMIDSEESWIQDVADGIVEEMMFRYNAEGPMIFNTLQMYRHDRLAYLEDFFRRARKKGIYAAFKLVRGAYMEKERERAARMNYPSPIYPDKDATDKAFDDAAELCVRNLDAGAVCVGTHNEHSCTRVVELMKQLDIAPGHKDVSFAQLLGMSDHISYNLANGGYQVCKYVPYGPVRTVVPYLIRRAEENTSVAGRLPGSCT